MTDVRTPTPPSRFERLPLGVALRRRALPIGAVPDEVLPSESDALSVVRRRESAYRRALVAADLVGVSAGFLTAITVFGNDQLRATSLLLLPLAVVVAKLLGLYDRDDLVLRKTTLDELPKLFQLATLVTLLTFFFSAGLLHGYLGRDQAGALWLLLTGLLTLSRAAARRACGATVASERCLVLGDADVLDRLRAKLDEDGRVDLVGSVPFEHVVHDSAELRRAAERFQAHRLILAPGDGAVATPETIEVIRMAKATGLRVSLLPGVLDVVGTAVEFDQLSGLTLLGVRRFGLSRSSQLTKRAFDLVAASGILLAAAPVMAVVAVLVKVTSPGPVLFRQIRVGRDGEHFRIIKFRSMTDGADAQRASLAHLNEAGDGLFKIADDPRVTRLGALLRRLSLDELPQLLNVVRGEMSLVGPRPLIVDEDEQITGLDRKRLQLTPGMTGQWQIAGSARVPLSEMVKIDYLYVAGWSIWSDTKILIRTAVYVLGRRGQ